MIRTNEEIEKIMKKINNPDFIARAREEVVAENRMRHQDLLEKLRKLESNLGHLPLK
jgi:valyl-tRNA synthetase